MSLLTLPKFKYLFLAAEVVFQLLQTAMPPKRGTSRNLAFLRDAFSEDDDQEALFCNSTTFSRARIEEAEPLPRRSFDERRVSAKMHTLFGVPKIRPSRYRFKSSYPYAVSVVYDLRKYTDENMVGG
jgi:hypothetical protein